MNNSSIINPVLPKGRVANCIWPGLIWSVALIREGGPNLGVWKAGRMWLPFRVPPRYRNWFTDAIVHHHAQPLYVPHCCTGAQFHTRQARYMYALKAPTCPRDKTSSTYPFQSCKLLSPQFCIVFLMHASSSTLGRSPVDCCELRPTRISRPVLGPVLAPVLGAVLGATIRIERTGAKTEAKTGPKSGPKSGTNFAKLFAHFFGHAANRCPQWSCPYFATFAFFLFARAHPCTHSATANSS